MNITHTKLYQHISVDNIEYSQYEQIVDKIYTLMPNTIVSCQYRKNLKTGFFVLMNLARSNKILKIFSQPPLLVKPKAKKSTKAKK